MAHVMKHTKASCGHMFAHYDRKEENISNENLDREKTYLNYNLATHQQMDQGDFVRQRCSEVHCQNRKDVNVMVSWVITKPKDLPEEQEQDFFKASYDFLEEKYGRENVVSSYVHMDEKTPHMHFAFVPVVPDERRGYKVSAKQCVNRSHLARFHGELEKYLNDRGIAARILNDATREGNQSIEELKRGTAVKTLQKVRKATRKEKADLQNLQKEKDALNREIEALKDLRKIQGEVLTAQQVKSIRTETVMFDDSKIKISRTDFENLRKTACAAENATKAFEASKSYLKQAEKILEEAEKKKREPIPEKLERIRMKKELEEYEKALDACEEPVKKAFKEARRRISEEQKKQVKTKITTQNR